MFLAALLIIVSAHGWAAEPVCVGAVAAGSRFQLEDIGARISPAPGDEHPEGAVVRTIEIHNGDVFDLDAPGQDGFVHRLLNALHMQTRAEVIERQLLLQPGDTFSTSLVDESARLLRENPFLASADIVPTDCSDGGVDLTVVTADSWSLTPSISFASRGGKTTGGFRLDESNLFGSGTELKIGYKSGIDRDSATIEYFDNQLRDSRVGLDLLYSHNSDGTLYSLGVAQPFYALDATRAGGIRIGSVDEVDSIYELGEIADEFHHSGRYLEAFFGWSNGLSDDHVRRWIIGLVSDEQRFAETPLTEDVLRMPGDRREIYPYLNFEWLEDRYETATNVNQIQMVEDWYLGARLNARIGYASRALGSMKDTWIAELSVQRGFHPGPQSTLILKSGVTGRWPSGGEQSILTNAQGQFFHRRSEKRLFVARLDASMGNNLDRDDVLTLGGDTGLRGYPARYQNGQARALLTLEERFYTDWYPFHLFRVGAAVFFDAGRVWGRRESAEPDLGILTDAGVGLRIGSPHSASGRMLHLDLAFPLGGLPEVGGPRLFIQTSKRF